MTKDNILKTLRELDAQLEKDKVIVDSRAGKEVPVDSDEARELYLIKLRLMYKFSLQEILLNEYGIFYF